MNRLVETGVCTTSWKCFDGSIITSRVSVGIQVWSPFSDKELVCIHVNQSTFFYFLETFRCIIGFYSPGITVKHRTFSPSDCTKWLTIVLLVNREQPRTRISRIGKMGWVSFSAWIFRNSSMFKKGTFIKFAQSSTARQNFWWISTPNGSCSRTEWPNGWTPSSGTSKGFDQSRKLQESSTNDGIQQGRNSLPVPSWVISQIEIGQT